MKKRSSTVLALTAAATAATLAVGPAAATPTVSDPIASGLAGPLQLDVGKGGILVGQSFAGLLTKVRRDGTPVNLASEPGEIAGVAHSRAGIAYAYTRYDDNNNLLAAQLKLRKPNGKRVMVANLKRVEQRRNPDGHQRYGFLGLPKSCADQVPAAAGGGDPYQGILDSHPYSVANAPHGGWYVADAAGNDILKVSRHGKVKVVHVVKPQRLVVTAEAAAAVGLPECTVGYTYAFEGVPTDVEVARSGKLFVSLLPGGPESPELGARGSVIKIHPRTHQARRVATGFVTATNLALAPHGKIYVTELFGNMLSVIKHGKVRPVVELTMPAAVEYFRGKLYVATDVFENGSIVEVDP
jgi:hypothetical protein